MTLVDWGPLAGGSEQQLLRQVLEAQDDASRLLSSLEIKRSADALLHYASALGDPVLVPVSHMADRLVGAALLLAGGALRARDDANLLDDESVVLVEAVATQSAWLLWQRDLLLGRGIKSVNLVALRLLDGPHDEIAQLFPAVD